MSGLLEITVIGHVGADPQMEFTNTGKAVTRFPIAVTMRNGDSDHTEWLNCSVWEKQAETCNQHVVKGMQIYVQGRVRLEEWTDKNGEKRARMAITGQKVVFLGKKPQNGGSEAGD